MKKHSLFPIWIFAILLSSCFRDPEPEAVIQYQNPAITSVSKQIEYNPNDSELYLSRASLFYEMEHYDEAIKDMKKAMSFDSSSLAYRHVLSDIYFDAGKNNEALGILEETIGLFPASEPTILKLSEFQYILKLNDAAIATIDKLMDVEPEHSEGHYMYGRIYSQKGEKAKAISHYKKVLEQRPRHFDALLELGTLYSLDKSKKALIYLGEAMKLAPNNPDIVFEMGNYHRFQGNNDKALEHYKQVTFLDNQYTDAHINAGIVMMDKKEFEKAEDFFNIAVETDPSYPSAYYYRGIASAYLGNDAKAKSDLQTALELAPSYEEAKEALLELK